MEPVCSGVPIESVPLKVITKGINYNESWKIKNMFLIANFINFLTKSVLSVRN